MWSRHVPAVNARYWAGIALASIVGTNLGDLYAHNSGLGLLGGLPILIGLFAAVFIAERYDRMSHEGWYWACILVMRTGATNIADYLAGKRGLAIDRTLLCIMLGLAIAALAWRAMRRMADSARSLPKTDGEYWLTMLMAGVFGTALGDLLSHIHGQGAASLGLALALAAVLLVQRRNPLPPVLGYWLTIAVARSAGTAIGDWLAENQWMNLGLPLCTLLTGGAFLAVLLAWTRQKPDEKLVANSEAA